MIVGETDDFVLRLTGPVQTAIGGSRYHYLVVIIGVIFIPDHYHIALTVNSDVGNIAAVIAGRIITHHLFLGHSRPGDSVIGRTGMIDFIVEGGNFILSPLPDGMDYAVGIYNNPRIGNYSERLSKGNVCRSSAPGIAAIGRDRNIHDTSVCYQIVRFAPDH